MIVASCWIRMIWRLSAAAQPRGFVHTDRGSTCCSHDARAFVRSHKALASMSRKGDPWDNACAETFFKAYKTEWVFVNLL